MVVSETWQSLKTLALPVFPIWHPWFSGTLLCHKWLEQLQNVTFSHVNIQRQEKKGEISLLLYQAEWSLSLSIPPLISIKENKSLYNRLPIVPHQNWLTWPPTAAGEPDKVSIWRFQPFSWEAGSASVENGVGGNGCWVQHPWDKTQDSKVFNVPWKQYQIFAPDHHAVETRLPEFLPGGVWNYSHWWQGCIQSQPSIS